MAISKYLSNAFSDIFQTMGITEDDLKKEQYELKLPKLDHDLKIQLENDGLIIENGLDNPDIMFSSPRQYVLFKQRPVLVYIRDQRIWEENFYANKFNPFHICFCDQLAKAKKEHRFRDRYVVTYNTSGRFLVNFTIREKEFGKVHIIDEIDNQYKELHVCHHCLHKLNWKNFQDYCFGEEWWKGRGWKDRTRIVNQFSIKEFFDTVNNNLILHKEELYGAALAPKDGNVMTPKEKHDLKVRANHRCEKCGKFFAYDKLQIHHIEHGTGNNSTSNLMVLCQPCHAAIHRKEGGYILDD